MDKRVIDITGQKYGKFTVIERIKIEGKYHAFWKCECECGNQSIVCGSKLRTGKSKSCGCSINHVDFINIKKDKTIMSDIERLKIRLDTKVKWNKGCLEWKSDNRTTGDRLPLGRKGKPIGYGLIRYKNKMMLAHRASWLIHKGEVPDGMLVLHHCDNPLCVFIKHLYLGTHQDNSDHKIARGRSPNQGKGKRRKKVLNNTQL